MLIMSDWFSTLTAGSELPMDATSELQEQGFVVIPGHTRPDLLASAYAAAVASATSNDIRIGSTSTKVNDFVNRGAEFDNLYIFPPLLEACCRVIGRPFKLSSLHARTLRPGSPSQELHVDVPRDSADWPLLGFILMVDEFRPDNGATRFVPGSHRWSGTPEDALADLRAEHGAQLLACGKAGSAHFQRVRMAWSHSQHVEPAAPVTPGRVHSAGWACRDRLRRPHATRDACATRRSRAVCARALTGGP
jgi:hypothetical protein